MEITTKRHPVTQEGPSSYRALAFLNPSFSMGNETGITVLGRCRQTGNALMAARDYGKGGAFILAIRPEFLEVYAANGSPLLRGENGAERNQSPTNAPAGWYLMKRATDWLLAKNRFCGIKIVPLAEHFQGGLALEALVGLLLYGLTRCIVSGVKRLISAKRAAGESPSRLAQSPSSPQSNPGLRTVAPVDLTISRHTRYFGARKS